MTAERRLHMDCRIRNALDELRAMILKGWPTATFEVLRGADAPEIVELWTTVDVEDPDVVTDAVMDRLLELEAEAEGGLPVCVVPVRPVERVLLEMNTRAAGRSPRPAAAPLDP
jgi:hypothetical protein